MRKSRKQKKSFRDAVQSYAETLGYQVTIESGSFGSRNIVIGDPETARYLITAHYDTPVWLWTPRWLAPCGLPLFLLGQLLTVLGILLPSAAAAAVGAAAAEAAAVAAEAVSPMWRPASLPRSSI